MIVVVYFSMGLAAFTRFEEGLKQKIIFAPLFSSAWPSLSSSLVSGSAPPNPAAAPFKPIASGVGAPLSSQALSDGDFVAAKCCFFSCVACGGPGSHLAWHMVQMALELRVPSASAGESRQIKLLRNNKDLASASPESIPHKLRRGLPGLYEGPLGDRLRLIATLLSSALSFIHNA
ncbi:uncharacterized protein PG986_011314 [Apiospora aurea]|uniref:Uncharacterized protein n=1 Tax=Apiospora aurea TaxID=335848 RepID=A0ABR1Q4Q0_9PEZI